MAETCLRGKINDSGRQKRGTYVFMVSQVKQGAGQEVHVLGRVC